MYTEHANKNSKIYFADVTKYDNASPLIQEPSLFHTKHWLAILVLCCHTTTWPQVSGKITKDLHWADDRGSWQCLWLLLQQSLRLISKLGFS